MPSKRKPPQAKPRPLIVRETTRPSPTDVVKLRQIGAAFERSDARKPVRTDGRTAGQSFVRPDGRPIVAGIRERPGRILVDGSRRGAKVVSRIEIQPPIEWKLRMQAVARATGKTITELVMEYCEQGGFEAKTDQEEGDDDE